MRKIRGTGGGKGKIIIIIIMIIILGYAAFKYGLLDSVLDSVL